jgi:hypothetical protein
VGGLPDGDECNVQFLAVLVQEPLAVLKRVGKEAAAAAAAAAVAAAAAAATAAAAAVLT